MIAILEWTYSNVQQNIEQLHTPTMGVTINKKETKIVSEYDQEIPQSQTADNPVEPRGRAAQPSRDTRKTN